MTVRELIKALLDHEMDGEVAVYDRSGWDALGRIMNDPETNPEVVLGIGVARLGGEDVRLTNDLVDVMPIRDGDFRTMLVISHFTGG